MGWADVATKHDLANLEHRMELRFTSLEERLDERFKVIDERFKAVDENFKGLGWRFEGLEDRMKAANSDLRATFEHELRSQTMTMMFGLISVVLTMAALAFALVRFT